MAEALADTLVSMLRKEICKQRDRSPHFDPDNDQRIPWILCEVVTVLTCIGEMFEMLDELWAEKCPVVSGFFVLSLSGTMQLIGSCATAETGFLNPSRSGATDAENEQALSKLQQELDPMPARWVEALASAETFPFAHVNHRKLACSKRVLRELTADFHHPALDCIWLCVCQFEVLWTSRASGDSGV